jgi:hypothetical protein
MSKSRNMADLLDSNGDVKSGALDNVVIPQVDDEVAVGATAPSSPFEGQLWFDTSTGVKALKYYNGTTFKKVSPDLPSISSISGNIVKEAATTLTLTGIYFGTSPVTVKFSGSGFSDASVSVTPTSDTEISVAVPSAVYNGVSVNDSVVITVVTDDAIGIPKAQTVLALAEGGTITESGGYKIHTFTSSGTFTANSAINGIEYLVVAGGGAGGNSSSGSGGGGGAGGFRTNVSGATSGGGASAEASMNLPSGTYTVTVGAGGSSVVTINGSAKSGTNSVFHTVTSIGGGGGGSASSQNALSGGSGGGAEGNSGGAGSGTSGQGYAGGNADTGGWASSGGGGAGAAGQAAYGGPTNDYIAGNGGVGVQSSITGTATYYAGGGGGADYDSGTLSNGRGGAGGGGGGATQNSSANGVESGSANTGGGGGGCYGVDSGAGGSGIVIIRYAI